MSYKPNICHWNLFLATKSVIKMVKISFFPIYEKNHDFLLLKHFHLNSKSNHSPEAGKWSGLLELSVFEDFVVTFLDWNLIFKNLIAFYPQKIYFGGNMIFYF